MMQITNKKCTIILLILSIVSFVDAAQPINVKDRLFSFAKGFGSTAVAAGIACMIAPSEYQRASMVVGSCVGAIIDHYVGGQHDPNLERKLGYLIIPGCVLVRMQAEWHAKRLSANASSDRGYIQSNTDEIVNGMFSNDPDMSPEGLRESAIRYKFHYAIVEQKNSNIQLQAVTSDEIASHASDIVVVVTIGNRQVVCDSPAFARALLDKWQQQQQKN